MKKCIKCSRPLTEFEILFHQKAKSDESLSCQCWRCSGAEKAFGYQRNYLVEIKVCLICFVIAAIGVTTIAPIIYESNIMLLEDFMPLILFPTGLFSTITILKQNKYNNFSDPLENHYTTDYGSTHTWYESTIEDSGKIVTEEKSYTSSSTKNNWKHYGLGFYILMGILMVPTFIFWCIPYIIYLAFKTRKATINIPPSLSKAYEEARAEIKKVPITRDDKIKYLMSRDSIREKQREEEEKKTTSFFDNYIQKEKNISNEKIPFALVKNKNVSCMIVEYKYERYKNYGICFLLLKNSQGKIEKKMSIGESFVYSEECEWNNDWLSAGANPDTINNIEEYQKLLQRLA